MLSSERWASLVQTARRYEWAADAADPDDARLVARSGACGARSGTGRAHRPLRVTAAAVCGSPGRTIKVAAPLQGFRKAPAPAHKCISFLKINKPKPCISNFLVGPIPGRQELLKQSRFRRTTLHGKIVNPPHCRRQRHQDGFDSPASLQAEEGAPVIQQIKFHVSAAAKFLKEPVTVRIRMAGAFLHNWKVGSQEGVARFAHEGEGGLPISFQIIEEDSTHAPCFAAMGQKKILVAPLLKAAIVYQLCM